MPFTVAMTSTANVDDSIIQAYDAGFLIALAETASLDQFVTYRADIGAKAIEFPKYSQLAVSTTPLDEVEDVDSQQVVDSKITLTPREYGAVVTRTNLASLQTGGKIDLAIPRLVGMNLGTLQNKLFLNAVNGSANTNPGVLNAANANILYTKLARANVQGVAGAEYVAVAHEDDLALLRAESAWIDVQKYADAVQVLKNEVGMFAGLRFVRNNDQTIGTVAALGFNAIGKAVSQEARITFTGPFDKLSRYLNIGHYGVYTYGRVESDAIQLLVAP